jgi:hypothetical protein
MHTRIEVDDDVESFNTYALDQGWSDGFPVVAPTEERVRRHITASGRAATDELGVLPPGNTMCTVESAAVNAVLAGAPPESMGFICSAIEMLADPEMSMLASSTTTNAAAPLFIVNGEARDRLAIPYQAGCMGGAATRGVAIGRALRLAMRNVGGELIGSSSKSVFGQPARLGGLVFGEWEEQSPWQPLGVRLGSGPDALTSFVTTGTEDIVDITARTGHELVQVIGRSLAYPAQAVVVSQSGGELVLCLCPPWASIIGKEFPDIADLQHELWRLAVVPRADFPASFEAPLQSRGMFDEHGNVRVVPGPENIHVLVAGGTANLHAFLFRGFGPHKVVTRSLS